MKIINERETQKTNKQTNKQKSKDKKRITRAEAIMIGWEPNAFAVRLV